MRIFATADFHFSPRTAGRVRSIARKVEREATEDDVLVVAGDVATGISEYGADPNWDCIFDLCLDHFEGFPGNLAGIV